MPDFTQKTPKKKQLRPLGDILLDMEKLIVEMVVDHGLQWGDVLYNIYGYLKIHLPGGQETYVDDGSHPEFYYGPRRKK